MDNLALVIDQIEALRKLGLRLCHRRLRHAGYSSLSHWANLPVDCVKIDRSFVKGPGARRGGGCTTLVRGIVALAHSLHLQVVAEGVENGRAASLAQDPGLRHQPGLLFASPHAGHGPGGTAADRSRARGRAKRDAGKRTEGPGSESQCGVIAGHGPYYGGMGPLEYRSLDYRSFAHRSWVEISLQQIANNFRAVCDVVGPGVEVMPVVKADAYRQGPWKFPAHWQRQEPAAGGEQLKKARFCAIGTSRRAFW